MKQIRLDNICFSYDKKSILKGISSTINKGEIVALLGANGSGKSTLMKCINRVLDNYEGDVYIDNQNTKKLSNKEVARKIAYVPQYESKILGLKVFDMIMAGRMPYISWQPSNEDYKIVYEVIEKLGLSHLAMNDFGEMSGGQQQMVYIARSIVQESPIILLDEPINNLDMRHQVEIMKLLKELSSQGKTIIITLHDINLALQYCNKYILLKSGKIFAQGEQEILTENILEQIYSLKVQLIKNNNSIFVNPYLD